MAYISKYSGEEIDNAIIVNENQNNRLTSIENNISSLEESIRNSMTNTINNLQNTIMNIQNQINNIHIPDIKLNYSVIGGTTQPTNPIENMIWVNTNINITNYIFNKYEPENPQTGDIWFVTGDNSIVTFYSLKINNNYIDEFHPGYAKQYQNDTWIDVDVKSYINGKWIDWTTYLYKQGDECLNLTNGWALSVKDNTSSHGESLAKTATNLTFSSWHHSGVHYAYGFLRTNNKIDLSNIKKITMTVESVSSPSCDFALLVSLNDYINVWDSATSKLILTDSGTRTVSLDVTALTGAYYIGVAANAADGADIVSTVIIKDICIN